MALGAMIFNSDPGLFASMKVDGKYTVSNLAMRNVRMRDSGTYECQVAGNSPGEATLRRDIELQVVDGLEAINYSILNCART